MLQLQARTNTAVDNMADMMKVVDELIMLTRRIHAVLAEIFVQRRIKEIMHFRDLY